jgi:hypothetical protein
MPRKGATHFAIVTFAGEISKRAGSPSPDFTSDRN